MYKYTGFICLYNRQSYIYIHDNMDICNMYLKYMDKDILCKWNAQSRIKHWNEWLWLNLQRFMEIHIIENWQIKPCLTSLYICISHKNGTPMCCIFLKFYIGIYTENQIKFFDFILWNKIEDIYTKSPNRRLKLIK